MKKRMKKLRLSNKGFSLIELIVTMLVSSIVTAAVVGFLAMGLNFYRRTNAETALQTESQVAELFLTELLQECQTYNVLTGYPSGVTYAVEISRDGVMYIVAQKGEYLVFGEADMSKTSDSERIQSVSGKGMEDVFLAKHVQLFTLDPTERSVAVEHQKGLVKMISRGRDYWADNL